MKSSKSIDETSPTPVNLLLKSLERELEFMISTGALPSNLNDFFMRRYKYLLSKNETLRASMSPPSTETPSSESTLTFSHNLLSVTYSGLEILEKRLASLKQILIQMDECVQPITLLEQRPDVFLQAYLSSELEQISRISKNFSDRFSLLMKE